MPYRVTQYSDVRGKVHSKAYNSLLWAKIIAWVMEGPGTNGERYTTTLEDEW